MSEERFSKIEGKQVEHDKILDKVTYLIERVEESLEKMEVTIQSGLEKMDNKVDDLHARWAENNALLTSYSSMKDVFKETTDKLQLEVKKSHEDIEKIREWQAVQEGKSTISKAFWGLASAIFGGFVTAVMTYLVLGK